MSHLSSFLPLPAPHPPTPTPALFLSSHCASCAQRWAIFLVWLHSCTPLKMMVMNSRKPEQWSHREETSNPNKSGFLRCHEVHPLRSRTWWALLKMECHVASVKRPSWYRNIGSGSQEELAHSPFPLQTTWLICYCTVYFFVTSVCLDKLEPPGWPKQ